MTVTISSSDNLKYEKLSAFVQEKIVMCWLIIIIMIINCNSAVAQWEWLFHM